MKFIFLNIYFRVPRFKLLLYIVRFETKDGSIYFF